ncbi:MAG: hypothetical protein ACR2OZ_01055 [Verrucomicrobiales bacterium]
MTRLGVSIANRFYRTLAAVFFSVPVLASDATERTARIETKALSALIVDNKAYGSEHRAGYNGVAELTLKVPEAKNLFVPRWAGLNFEHIFSGDAESFSWNIFEPRRAPMQLLRRTPNCVELQQERTENWPLRSRLTYEAKGDAIDFAYFGTPLADVWKKHGYIGVFFASYIDAPSAEFVGELRFW